ncbi:hypothetical protein C3941_06025 [Kaistia algarum]|nr:hypothetical protein C3941_06025 [Kaistia algarum]
MRSRASEEPLLSRGRKAAVTADIVGISPRMAKAHIKSAIGAKVRPQLKSIRIYNFIANF